MKNHNSLDLLEIWAENNVGFPSNRHQDVYINEEDEYLDYDNLSEDEPSNYFQNEYEFNGDVSNLANLYDRDFSGDNIESREQLMKDLIEQQVFTLKTSEQEIISNKPEKQSNYLDYVVFRTIVEEHTFKICQGKFIYLYDETYGYFSELLENELKVFIRKSVPPEIDKRLNDHKMNEVIKRLQSCPELQVKYEEFDQCVGLCNFLNGVYNIRKGELVPHSPRYLFTSCINAEFSTEEDTEGSVSVYRKGVREVQEGKYFMKFINESTQGDQLKIKIIRQMMAYVISNYVRAKKMFIILGRAHSGKSLLTNLLVDIVGRSQVSGIPLHELNGRFQTAELFNKKLNISPEIGESIHKGIDVIKALTGGDLIKAERKGEQPFFFINKAKIVAVGNRMPEIKRWDSAFSDRITYVVFNSSVDEKNRDKDLLDKLLSEKNYIVRWALEELHDLVRNDFVFTECEDAIQFRNHINEGTESIAQFLLDRCEVDPSNLHLRAHRKHLYPAYTSYCKDNCLKASSLEEFFGEISKQGFEKGKFRMNGSDALRGFKGIALKNVLNRVLD